MTATRFAQYSYALCYFFALTDTALAIPAKLYIVINSYLVVRSRKLQLVPNWFMRRRTFFADYEPIIRCVRIRILNPCEFGHVQTTTRRVHSTAPML